MSGSEAPEFLHGLHDGFQLLDDGIHGMLLIVHLLGQVKHGLRLRLWHHGDTVAISHNNIIRTDGDSVAEQADLGSRKAVMMDRSGRNDSSGKHGKTNLAQIGYVAHSAVN